MITEEDYYEINISTQMYSKALDRAKNFESNNAMSICSSKGPKIAGFVAEEIIINNFGGKLIDDKKLSYDIDCHIGTIDVKTKRCRSRPLITYDCSVTEYQAKKQKSDYLLFCRCDYDFTKLWVLGIIETKEFLDKSTLIKKGDVDGRFVARTNMFNLKIKDLYNFMELYYSESN